MHTLTTAILLKGMPQAELPSQTSEANHIQVRQISICSAVGGWASCCSFEQPAKIFSTYAITQKTLGKHCPRGMPAYVHHCSCTQIFIASFLGIRMKRGREGGKKGLKRPSTEDTISE